MRVPRVPLFILSYALEMSAAEANTSAEQASDAPPRQEQPVLDAAVEMAMDDGESQDSQAAVDDQADLMKMLEDHARPADDHPHGVAESAPRRVRFEQMSGVAPVGADAYSGDVRVLAARLQQSYDAMAQRDRAVAQTSVDAELSALAGVVRDVKCLVEVCLGGVALCQGEGPVVGGHHGLPAFRVGRFHGVGRRSYPEQGNVLEVFGHNIRLQSADYRTPEEMAEALAMLRAEIADALQKEGDVPKSAAASSDA